MRKLLAAGLAGVVLLCGLATAVGAAGPQRAGRSRRPLAPAAFWSKACEIATVAHVPELALDALASALHAPEGSGAIASLLLGDDPLRCLHLEPSLSRQDLLAVEDIVAKEAARSQALAPFRNWLRVHGAQFVRTTAGVSPFSRLQLAMQGNSGRAPAGPFHVVQAGVSWFQVGYSGPVDMEVKAVSGTSGCYAFRRVVPRLVNGALVSVSDTVPIPAGTTWQAGIRPASTAEACTPLDGSLFKWGRPATIRFLPGSQVNALLRRGRPVRMRFSGSEVAAVAASQPVASNFSIDRAATPWSLPLRLLGARSTTWFLEPGRHTLRIYPRADPLLGVVWLDP